MKRFWLFALSTVSMMAHSIVPRFTTESARFIDAARMSRMQTRQKHNATSLAQNKSFTGFGSSTHPQSTNSGLSGLARMQITNFGSSGFADFVRSKQRYAISNDFFRRQKRYAISSSALRRQRMNSMPLLKASSRKYVQQYNNTNLFTNVQQATFVRDMLSTSTDNDMWGGINNPVAALRAADRSTAPVVSTSVAAPSVSSTIAVSPVSLPMKSTIPAFTSASSIHSAPVVVPSATVMVPVSSSIPVPPPLGMTRKKSALTGGVAHGSVAKKSAPTGGLLIDKGVLTRASSKLRKTEPVVDAKDKVVPDDLFSVLKAFRRGILKHVGLHTLADRVGYTETSVPATSVSMRKEVLTSAPRIGYYAKDGEFLGGIKPAVTAAHAKVFKHLKDVTRSVKKDFNTELREKVHIGSLPLKVDGKYIEAKIAALTVGKQKIRQAKEEEKAASYHIMMEGLKKGLRKTGRLITEELDRTSPVKSDVKIAPARGLRDTIIDTKVIVKKPLTEEKVIAEPIVEKKAIVEPIVEEAIVEKKVIAEKSVVPTPAVINPYLADWEDEPKKVEAHGAPFKEALKAPVEEALKAPFKEALKAPVEEAHEAPKAPVTPGLSGLFAALTSDNPMKGLRRSVKVELEKVAESSEDVLRKSLESKRAALTRESEREDASKEKKAAAKREMEQQKQAMLKAEQERKAIEAAKAAKAKTDALKRDSSGIPIPPPLFDLKLDSKKPPILDGLKMDAKNIAKKVLRVITLPGGKAKTLIEEIGLGGHALNNVTKVASAKPKEKDIFDSVFDQMRNRVGSQAAEEPEDDDGKWDD